MNAPRLALCFSFVAAFPLAAQTSAPLPTAAQQSLGGAKYEHWSGLNVGEDGTAQLSTKEPAIYRLPDGPNGWYRPRDFLLENDGVLDGRPWYGLQFEVNLDRDQDPLTVDLTLKIPPNQGRRDLLESSSTHTQIVGKGWHTITVPWSSFDYQRGQVNFLKYLKEIDLQGRFAGAAQSGAGAKIRNPRLILARTVHLASPVLSQPADGAGTVEYPIVVTNCLPTPQTFVLELERSGWEGMPAELSPAAMMLQPGEAKTATLRVTVPGQIPPGAQETQRVVARPADGSAAATKLEFITLRRLPFPFLLHDAKGWDEVRAKAKTDWGKEQAARTIKEAGEWQVPQPYPNNRAPDGTVSVFKSYLDGTIEACGIAWKLTGDRKYAEKAALFLRRLSNPENGYPKTLHANSQGIPQEGGFFEACAATYDMIDDAGVLSADDRRHIEQTFRLYIGVIKDMQGDGGISNWSVFNLCPAAMCALVIHDMAEFNTLMNGPCGIVDQLRYGMLADGWWYEMSLAYNLGCANVFTKLGLAAKPFGIDFLNQKFPIALTSRVGLRPFEFENFQGMGFGKFGPLPQNTVTLKQMWDGILIYPDYRGVMFGMGDGHESVVSGGAFEQAYAAFRDPAYASIIKTGRRSLLAGVPELPAETPVLYQQSGFSANAGLAVLRSQTPGREQREQIQVAAKYGTHGSYHGHFDRISLVSLMRYGRSFYNPETSWFGYGSYMYKWWVQVSLSHNMVVVDGKMQEPKECQQLLFHSGPMLQVVAAETTARWSNPPYFGGYEQIEKVKAGDAPYVNVPADHPKPADVTDYSEPVRQRRIIVVTDDYVVLADDLAAAKEHTFDNLLHLRGATLPESGSVKLIGHQAQFDTNPLGSGQFISNVNRYDASAPVIIPSIHRIAGKNRAEDSFASDGQNWETGGAKSLSEPGELHLDEHVLWPAKAEVLIGDYAESWSVNKNLSYEVKGDGKMLASGTFGAWILGSGAVDVDVTGIQQLELRTMVKAGNSGKKTVFWGNPVLVTADGHELPLAQCAPTQANVLAVPQVDRDYEGGPVRIAGMPFAKSTAAEPAKGSEPGVITVDLKGRNVVRLKTTVGGDWPVGNEEQLRKTVSVRSKGNTAQFLTLIEPYEKQSVIKSATASGPDKLRVELKDGRVQELTIANLSGPNPAVTITESKGGSPLRTETAQ